MKKRKTILLIWLPLLILLLAALLTAYLLNLRSGDRILPNVVVSGVEVGGMSRTEAESALSVLCTDADRRFTVVLPDGTGVSRSFSELGLCVNVPETVSSLLCLGRTGDFFSDLNTILSALCGTCREFEAAAPALKEEALSALAAEAAALVRVEPTDPLVFREESRLKLTTGTAGRTVEIGALFAALRESVGRGETAFALSAEPVPAASVDIEALYDLLYEEPVNAEFQKDGSITPEQYGKTFDLEAAKSALAAVGEGETLEIPLETLIPERIAAEAEPLLFRDRLSSTVGYLTDNETRSNNIRLAAASVDGLILLPGEVFSYNEALGERTAARGYGEASAYSFGRIVEEVGGGICQLSSELYMCCLLADMEIVERTNHAYYQSYVPYGFDATVSWGGPDFRFRNSGDYPLKIQAKVTGGALSVELWGTKETEGYIELEYEINQFLPASVQYEKTDTLAPGKTAVADYGRDGMKVYTYRVYYDANGKALARKQEAFSEYDARDKLILVGSTNPEEG